MDKLPVRLLQPRILLSAMVLLLAGCHSDSDDSPFPPTTSANYEIEITNLTAGQPFSPIAVIAHTSEFRLFRTGAVSALSLEVLAEAGDNADLLDEANVNEAVFETNSAVAPLSPGDTETLSFSISADNIADLHLSVVSMLVNTNDAFMAVNGSNIADLELNDSTVLNVIAYDAGTEANTEAVGTVPGPADGGQGFDPARDDIADRITAHSGVITAADSLADSVLDQIHRWDNPVARIRVTRTQ